MIVGWCIDLRWHWVSLSDFWLYSSSATLRIVLQEVLRNFILRISLLMSCLAQRSALDVCSARISVGYGAGSALWITTESTTLKDVEFYSDTRRDHQILLIKVNAPLAYFILVSTSFKTLPFINILPRYWNSCTNLIGWSLTVRGLFDSYMSGHLCRSSHLPSEKS